MTKSHYLLDTDVLIDWLRGESWVKDLIWSPERQLYCSSITRKELLSMRGLTASERCKIFRLLRLVRVLNVEATIAAAASELLEKYRPRGLQVGDALVAATAWIKSLPLITRNRRHYEFIAEIELATWLPEED